MPVATGKRYKCAECGAEFIVTRGGDGELRGCNNTALQQL
ncbi:MAG: desulfoferrodoxin [Dehalococcoidia bacterium]|nr:desulfoferrodoxin [Dehalococcoidia bacterium]